MRLTPIILLGMAILAYALSRVPDRIKPAWSQRLEGWQTLFGVVAVILALLIIISPEFLALGLLGDTTFFDVLVLLLSLQLQGFAARAWRSVCGVFSRMMRVMIPRMSISFFMVVMAFVLIGDVVSAIQKAVHRICS